MTTQYRVRRHTRIHGRQYAPGDAIRNPERLRNVRTLIAARYIEPFEPEPELEPEPVIVVEANDTEPEPLHDPLGELSNDDYDALTPQAKGARTRRANAAVEAEE